MQEYSSFMALQFRKNISTKIILDQNTHYLEALDLKTLVQIEQEAEKTLNVFSAASKIGRGAWVH